MEYDTEYVNELKELVNELIQSMENMLSIVDEDKKAKTSPLFAANQANLLIDQYYKFERDNSND